MLLGNYTILNRSPMRKFGGTQESCERSNFSTSGALRNRQLVDGTTTALAYYAIPGGYYPSYAWMIPQKSGGIGSGAQIIGAASASVNLAGGVNGQASLSGSGGITSATAGLIVSLVANLTGSGTISSSDLRGFLELVASISGSSGLAVTAGALAWASAAVSGGGDITTATPYATGALSANIKSYGDLTPEGLRDAVWNSIAASYNTTGTMGQKLNSAASGGIDYHALGLAVWDMLKSDVVTPESMGEQLKAALTTGKFLALK